MLPPCYCTNILSSPVGLIKSVKVGVLVMSLVGTAPWRVLSWSFHRVRALSRRSVRSRQPRNSTRFRRSSSFSWRTLSASRSASLKCSKLMCFGVSANG